MFFFFLRYLPCCCVTQDQSLPGFPGTQESRYYTNRRTWASCCGGYRPLTGANALTFQAARWSETSGWSSISLWLTVKGYSPRLPQEAVLIANPRLGITVISTFGLSNGLWSLLLACLPGGWELPVDQGEPTEDEEHPSPPQDLLALSIQHVA